MNPILTALRGDARTCLANLAAILCVPASLYAGYVLWSVWGPN